MIERMSSQQTNVATNERTTDKEFCGFFLLRATQIWKGVLS